MSLEQNMLIIPAICNLPTFPLLLISGKCISRICEGGWISCSMGVEEAKNPRSLPNVRSCVVSIKTALIMNAFNLLD